MLDCGFAVETPLHSHFGQGSGPVIGPKDCGHQRDVAVICSGRRNARLEGGVSRCSGRLEILYAENWETVCDRHWDLNNANVVCAQLDCGVAVPVPRGVWFGEGTGPIWRNRFECNGNETSLMDCPLSAATQHECTHRSDVRVICSNGSWPLRLTNGESRCDGRVEIHKGSWGRVQDSLWDQNDADVVCRQLDCGSAIAASNSSKYGEGEGPVWVNEVQCKGNESHLHNCSSFTFNSTLTDSTAVGVLCSGHEQIRLSDGGTRCAGRVEVYHNGIWGSICADSWELLDAAVVCRQLDCGHALDRALPASCGPASGPVWLQELNCFGNESFLWDCPSASWNNHDCARKNVNIMCSEHKEMRLVNGKHRCEGRVEVFYNGTWGTVCSATLDDHDATVICKQLQCGRLNRTERFGPGSGQIWLDEIECNLNEQTLWQCQSNPWGQHNCGHWEDAGVVCSEVRVTKEQPHSSMDCVPQSDSGQSLRLVGGDTSCSGRVEILSNNRWGTVCDDSWDLVDANVVCRQRWCGSALSASGGAAFGQGEGVIWLDEVKCTGNESFLSDCPSSSSARPDCDHKEDAAVICSGPEIETIPIPVAFCITAGFLLICELIALMAVMRFKLKRKAAVRGGRGSAAGLYQAIYEEIENIPPGKYSAQTHGSVSASIDSLNQIEYYTSHSLGDMDPGSDDPDGNSCSVQGPVPGDYDDVETEAIETQGGHLLLGSGSDDPFTGTSSGDLSSLEYSSQTRTDPSLPLPSEPGNNEEVHRDTFTASELLLPMGSDYGSNSDNIHGNPVKFSPKTTM
ncbi:scavenger receptor cysteine-rich domain-containing protein DMBT1-like [Scyliorhinus torazame]|uniref:scavenger receptor cysteine-rich domain-containing protein DMBT1-like n=1 Tax=Scyliorhinus torazame TaxID=75743 RepID=UPI003B5CD922